MNPNVDPFIASARHIYELSLAELRSTIEGMSAEGLNWRPDAPDTNSAAVLIHHVLRSTREWICMAVEAPRPPRVRDEEFLSSFDSEEEALALVDSMRAETLAYLDAAGDVDWAAENQHLVALIEPGDPRPTHAYCLMHAIEHLREHVAHLQLTRQLWDSRLTLSP